MSKKEENITTKFSVDITELKSGIQEANRQIKLANSEFKAISSSMNDWSKSTDGLQAKINQLNKVLSAEEQKLQSLKKQHELIVKEQGANSVAAQNLEIKINNQQAAVNKVANELNKYNTNLDELENASKQASNATNNLDNSLNNLQNSSERASGGFTVLKGVLTDLASNVIQNIASSIKDFGTSIIEVGSNFEAGMSEVQAISNASSEDLEKLSNKAKELGSTTKFSASESADAFKYMAMAGWDVETMLQSVDGVLNLAASSGTDLATTSDIVTDAMTAFGLKANEAGRFADVLAAASSSANTNVELMGETFNYVAPVAGALNYTVEDTAVAIGLMANAGIKGSQAGTALRSIMTRLVAPTKESGTAMDLLGISIQNQDGTMKSFDEIMNQLRTTMSGLSEDEQALFAKQIAGQEAMSGLLAIVNTSEEDFNKLSLAINNSSGTAQKMADTMNDNLKGSITEMGSAMEGLQIKIFEGIEKPLKSLVEAITTFITFITNNGSQITSFFISLATGVASYVAYTTAVQVFTQGWKSLSIVQKAVTAAQLAMNTAMNANPIGIIISLIAALVAGLIHLWNTNEDFRNFVITCWESIKDVFSKTIEWICKKLDDLKNFFTTTIPQSLENLKQKFTESWENIKNKTSEIWQGILDFLSGIINNIVIFFTETIPKAIEIYIQAHINLWKKIIEIINKIWEKFIEWGKNLLNFATTTIPEFINKIIEFISQLPSKIWEWLKQTFDKVVQWGKDLINKGIEISSNLVDNIINGVKELPSKLFEIGKNTVYKLWDGIISMGSWLKDKVSGFFSNIFNNVKSSFVNDTNNNIKSSRNLPVFKYSTNKSFNPTNNLNNEDTNLSEIGNYIPNNLKTNIFKNLTTTFRNNIDNIKNGVIQSTNNLKQDINNINFSKPLGPNNNNITFNQYNSSPKALSRMDIYKQTRGALFELKRRKI